ncbi:hypothetical protein Pan14r_36370 [Crateriforma conspicua]|uniref:Uncharacterized protein n=1 Tax=Crateriforma conspicua TaxID=2527996 RepID=A0A5C5Y6Q2_9PLAN|nr:hypothetical protein Pan14r_36370 [Crateriforma conspicua]
MKHGAGGHCVADPATQTNTITLCLATRRMWVGEEGDRGGGGRGDGEERQGTGRRGCRRRYFRRSERRLWGEDRRGDGEERQGTGRRGCRRRYFRRSERRRWGRFACGYLSPANPSPDHLSIKPPVRRTWICRWHPVSSHRAMTPNRGRHSWPRRSGGRRCRSR